MWLIPWVLAQLIYSFPPTVWSIRCVQCSSLSNPLCVSGRVRPSACTTLGPEAHYCVRYIGKLDNGRIVYRDCSRKDMGIGCMKKRNTKKRDSPCMCNNVCNRRLQSGFCWSSRISSQWSATGSLGHWMDISHDTNNHHDTNNIMILLIIIIIRYCNYSLSNYPWKDQNQSFCFPKIQKWTNKNIFPGNFHQ